MSSVQVVIRSEVSGEGRDTYSDDILNPDDVEEGLDLLPQTEPGPVLVLEVLAQVALDDLQSQTVENQTL